MSAIIPSFFEESPKPSIETRLYHGSKIVLWFGKVDISKIKGWSDNPRLELEMKRWKNELGDRDIYQDELFDMMKNTHHVRLKELSDNIRVNGLREPIVLTFDGKLLDGNRRFFAVKLAYENERDESKKRDLKLISAFVLKEDTSKQDQDNILVEENFSPSLKREWPDYVKAQYIKDAKDDGMSRKDIASKFGWSASKVRETLKTCEVMEAFIGYVTGDKESGGLDKTDLEAEKIASDHYQFFNEAQKSFNDEVTTNPDFAELFYKLIAQGDFFNRFDEVRCAYQGYEDEIARKILTTGDTGGGKDLKALIQLKNSNLKKLQNVQERIEEFTTFLNELSTEDKKKISDDSLLKLQETLILVQDMVNITRD